MGRQLKNNGKMLQSYGLWLDDYEFNVCQIDVLYGKSLISDFLDNFLKKKNSYNSTYVGNSALISIPNLASNLNLYAA